MLAATITMLTPAIARIVFLLLAPEGSAAPGQGEPPPVSFALLPSFLANALLVAAMVRDWRRHGRPNPAYWIAGAGIVAVQIALIRLSSRPRGTASRNERFGGWAVSGTPFQGCDFAATIVFSASPRRDWNGRLRTTSRTSVWKP